MFDKKEVGIVTRVFSIYDKKAQAFYDPFFARFNGEASRHFEDIVAKPGSLFAKHAEDFALWCIGTFNSTHGSIEGFKPEFVCNASDFVPSAPAPELVRLNGGV